MLNLEEIKHLAKLARLEIHEEELASFQKELSSILDYFEQLKEISAKNTQITAHALDIKNIFREDETDKICDEKIIANMIKQAPNKKNGYVKVKAVLKWK